MPHAWEVRYLRQSECLVSGEEHPTPTFSLSLVWDDGWGALEPARTLFGNLVWLFMKHLDKLVKSW